VRREKRRARQIKNTRSDQDCMSRKRGEPALRKEAEKNGGGKLGEKKGIGSKLRGEFPSKMTQKFYMTGPSSIEGELKKNMGAG